MARLDPIWRRAPLRLALFPQILIAVMIGAAILAATAAARPGYLASSARAALDREIAEFSRWNTGLRITRLGSLARPLRVVEDGDPSRLISAEIDVRRSPVPEAVRAVGDRLARLTAPVENLGAPVLLMAGSSLRAENPVSGDDAQARLVFRDDWERNVTVVARGNRPGAWLSDTTAGQIGVVAGDEVVLRLGNRSVTTPIAGLYRDLAAERQRDEWAAGSDLIYKAANADTYPPPPILMTRDLFFSLAAELNDAGRLQWNVPVRSGELSLDEARALAGDLSALITEHLSDYDSELVKELGFPGFYPSERYRSTAMDSVVAATRDQMAALRGPVDVVSLAASGVAAAILIAAGFYLVQRRRVEFASLVQRGVSPARLGLRVALELVLPTAIAGGIGLAGGLFAGGMLGPGRGFPREAAVAALIGSGIGVVAGVALAVVAVVLACRKEETVWGAPRLRGLRVTWEVLAASLALFVVWRMFRAEGSVGGEGPSLRLDVLLFPLLAVLSAGALAMAGAQWLLRAGRGAARRLPPSLYLAARRLANSSGTAVALVAACAFSVGVFTYAALLESSTKESARAKAYLFSGADASALVAPLFEGEDLPLPWTYVVRFQRFWFEGGSDSVPIIGVDPQTFERAAFWKDDFAADDLDELLSNLEGPENELRVVSVGGARVPEKAEVGISARVVGRADYFPGQVGDEPILVASRDRLLDALAGEASAAGRADELWMRGGSDRARAALAAAEIPYYSLRTADAVLEAPSLQSLSWALRLLRALGLGALVLSVLGLLLYLQARERATTVTSALAARMRFTRRSHLAMLAAENVVLLGLGLGVGMATGGAIVTALLPRFDLLPQFLPPPVVVVPTGTLVVVGLAGLVLAVAGAWFARAMTARRDIVEVLRS